jgi:hypothetical protein
MPLERLIEYVRERPVDDGPEPIILPAPKRTDPATPTSAARA